MGYLVKFFVVVLLLMGGEGDTRRHCPVTMVDVNIILLRQSFLCTLLEAWPKEHRMIDNSNSEIKKNSLPSGDLGELRSLEYAIV